MNLFSRYRCIISSFGEVDSSMGFSLPRLIALLKRAAKFSVSSLFDEGDMRANNARVWKGGVCSNVFCLIERIAACYHLRSL